MSPLISTLAGQILKNKHTSGAAGVYVLAKIGCPILAVWWPSHKQQLDSTAQLLETGAVFYGFAAAGDASKSADKDDVAKAIQTGDTTILTKPPP